MVDSYFDTKIHPYIACIYLHSFISYFELNQIVIIGDNNNANTFHRVYS